MAFLRVPVATEGQDPSPDICLSNAGTASWTPRGPFLFWREIVCPLSYKSIHLPDSKSKPWRPGMSCKIPGESWREIESCISCWHFPPYLQESPEAEMEKAQSQREIPLVSSANRPSISIQSKQVEACSSLTCRPCLTLAPLPMMTSECIFNPYSLAWGLGMCAKLWNTSQDGRPNATRASLSLEVMRAAKAEQTEHSSCRVYDGAAGACVLLWAPTLEGGGPLHLWARAWKTKSDVVLSSNPAAHVLLSKPWYMFINFINWVVVLLCTQL